MLAIRMQRTGRKGHAMFRMVVQDSRLAPTSGKIVARIGSYDPHAKSVVLDKEKASFYLEHGARPSDRTTRLLQANDVKLPSWVDTKNTKQGKLRHADKLRRNRPKEEVPAETTPEPEEKVVAEASEVETAQPQDEGASEAAPEEKPATAEDKP